MYTLEKFDFLHRLHSLIRHDEEEQYLSSLQGSQLARLVDLFDKVRTAPSAFHQFTRRTHRPSAPFPLTTIFLDNVYTGYKPSAATTRSYHPHTPYLMKSPESVIIQSSLVLLPKHGRVVIVARERLDDPTIKQVRT